MSMNTTVSFPFFSILGLIFITLKLTNYITWSWWWVLAPFWAPAAAVIAIMVVLLLFAMIVVAFNGFKK